MDQIDAEVQIDVPFHDVDMFNFVWHGRFVKYVEIARCALLETFGFNYQQMAESNYSWPIIDMRIQYVKPVRYGQRITVKAVLAEIENRLKINYVVFDAETGDRLAKGYTVQVAVDMETHEMCLASPKILREKLRHKRADR